MSTDPTLTDAEREALHRAVAATINYHSFDAAADTADFDMADAILDTNLAASSHGLAYAVELIIAARVAEARADEREQIAWAMSGVGAHRDPCRLPDTSCLCGVCEFREEAARIAREGGQR